MANSISNSAAAATDEPVSTASDRSNAFVAKLPRLAPGCKRVYLLRHGQTDWNKAGLMQGGGYDIPLNENGKYQAECAAEALSSIPLDIIISSHLQRASQTADMIHTLHPSAFRASCQKFGEMRFGLLEGLAIHGPQATDETRKQFQSINEEMKRDKSVAWPGGGESTMDVETRTRAKLQEIVIGSPSTPTDAKNPDALAAAAKDAKHIAIVAHGRANKILLASLLHGDALAFSPIKQGNTCINVLDYYENESASGGRWQEVLLNCVDHTEVEERYR